MGTLKHATAARELLKCYVLRSTTISTRAAKYIRCAGMARQIVTLG